MEKLLKRKEYLSYNNATRTNLNIYYTDDNLEDVANYTELPIKKLLKFKNTNYNLQIYALQRINAYIHLNHHTPLPPF